MKKLLRKNLIGIIAIAVIVVCGGVAFGAVNSQAPDRGENPLIMENADHKEVFPEGKGYSLSKAKAKEYQLPEKKEKKQEEELINGSASSAFHFSSSSYSGSYRSFRSSFKTRKIDMTPTVKTNLKKTQKKTVGQSMAFYIEPKLYGKSSPDDDEYKLTVKYGDEELDGDYDKDSVTYNYSITVKEEGDKKIAITLVDVKRKKTLEATYKVVGVKEKVETYDVSCTAAFDTFDTIKALTSQPVEIDKNTELTAKEIIDAILGTDYMVNGTDGKTITSIAGFGKNTVVKLSSAAKQKLLDDKYVLDTDFLESYTTVDEDGSIPNDAFVPEGSKLTSVWKIYKVTGEGKTEKKEEITDYTKKIKITENTKILLQYEFVPKP